MKIKKIQEQKLEGRKVLMRVDLDVPIEDGKIQDVYRVESSKESIKYIASQKGVKLALLSHLGRPKDTRELVSEEAFDSHFSFRQMIQELQQIWGVKIRFVASLSEDLIKKELEKMQEGEVMLLENVRFYHEEMDNDESFARKLAKNFDFFVNESFAVAHREHMSIVGLPKFLPAFAGIHFQKEMEVLEKVKNHPEHPAVAVIGGAKIETKLPLIESFIENYDYVLVGGKIANEAIDQGLIFDKKVILPVDFANDDRLDIGEKTIEKFKDIISQAETIVWNGPLGKFEEEPFNRGTDEILDAIIESEAYSVTGGGESVQVLEMRGKIDKISFVSAGGGSMLQYMSSGDLAALDSLEEK